MKLKVLIALIVIISLPPIFATSLSTDSSSYLRGDSIHLTGSVDFVEAGQFITVQILNPSKSDFVQVDMFAPNSDGTFSRTYKADGPKWSSDGTYTLKLFYNQNNFQTTFEFSNISPESQQSEPESTPESQSESESKSTTSDEILEPELSSEQNSEITPTPDPQKEKSSSTFVKQKPKTHIPGFPALDKSPQYYFDRYEYEENYQKWFDSQFSGKSIENVVGYTPTHVSGFPDNSKPPQYYIDRYHNELNYQKWFDSQFPDQTIYGILGFPEPPTVPEWIKTNASWWSVGKINDDEFVSGLQFMIENNIIVIEDLPEPVSNSENIPDWIRNSASWWALEKISEKEFLAGIKYLITNGIVIVER